MKKIGVLYLEPEHFASEANQTIGLPIVGPDMMQRVANRRLADSAVTPEGEAMKRKVIAYFKANYGIDIVLRWSRKAGCSMCPCSPGFNISTESADYYGRLKDNREVNVWTKGKSLDVRMPSYPPFRVNEHAMVGLA